MTEPGEADQSGVDKAHRGVATVAASLAWEQGEKVNVDELLEQEGIGDRSKIEPTKSPKDA